MRLRGARITGRLDLENLTTKVGVELSDCLLGEGLVARDATLPGLVLARCRLEHPSQPPLDANRLTAAVLLLGSAVMTADCMSGAVGLAGAHLGELDCTGATIRNNTGPALAAERLQVDQDVHLCGFEAVGGGSSSVTLSLREMPIGGVLEFDPKRLEHTAGPRLGLPWTG